jgi:rhamnulokinase
MSSLYVSCELGSEQGRIMLGALGKDGLTVSEAGVLHGLTLSEKETVQWDISSIYQQVIAAARGIAAHEEPVRGISFHSSASDAVLFEANGTLVGPATRPVEKSGAAELKKILQKVPLAEFYDQTGLHPSAMSTLCQLAAEPSKKIRKAAYAMGLADAFNFLLGGVPRTELSHAGQTQFFNPMTQSWCASLLQAGGVPEKMLAPLVPAGTVLGQIRAEIAKDAGLEDARVVSTCSNQLAAALAALNIADADNWAFLWPGSTSLVGTMLGAPFINEVTRDMHYANLTGYGEAVGLYKEWPGLKFVDECHAAWSLQDRAMDADVLMHLATSAPPLQSLIDPSDARFSAAADMPQQVQTYCRETGQEPPRKPGPILRCILESLALQYRKALLELEYISGTHFTKLYVLGGPSNGLLHHFLTNALQLPVVIVPSSLPAVGNIVIQAMALGHIGSAEEARDLVNHCLKLQTINPHASAWTEAYERFLNLGAESVTEQEQPS